MNTFNLDAICTDYYTSAYKQNARRPVIGITGNYDEQTCKLAEGYYKQIVNAGGTPLILPPTDDKAAIETMLDSIDALMLSGGADINPLFQNEESEPQLGSINAERDMPELLLTRLAFNRQMPILGICRGIQTLAVALGGKVAQHISTDIKHSQQAERHVATHHVTVSSGTLLNTLLNNEGQENATMTIAVNSFHHQAVKDAGQHLMVSATAPDGTIEAVESNEHKPIVGVQWHPECMRSDYAALFRWLVAEADNYHRVQRLHDNILTLDTHCDTPMFFPQGVDFTRRDERLLVNLPKMIEGRLDATIMVAYLPQKQWQYADGQWLPDSNGTTPRAFADNIFDKIEDIIGSNGMLARASTPDELWKNKMAGKKSIMLGIENGLALEGKADNLQHFVERGIVYITLCHNGDNDICDSAKGSMTHNGVSTFGEQVIKKMNELGIMVDMSHASEKSFYDALDISSMPIVCSHSSCRALCDHPRNLNDDQLRALAAKGGVCQITLYPGFLKSDGEATIVNAMQHLEHAISIVGIDHVGLGTDFDGDGGVRGLAHAGELTLFTRQLMKRRFNDNDIQKIWGGNFLRVMQQVQQAVKH